MEQIVFATVTPADAAYKAVFDLREEVLRKPIGLSLHNEDLSDEVNDYILTATIDNNLAGCLILTPKGNGTLQLRQMAVSPDMQGKNIGKQLVVFAEQFAREQGYTHIMLHARTVAQGFYDKLGYRQSSEIFTEVGIPHIEMEKHLH